MPVLIGQMGNEYSMIQKNKKQKGGNPNPTKL